MKFTFLILLFWVSSFFYGQNLTDNRFIVTTKVDNLLKKRSDCFDAIKTSYKYYHIQLYNGQSVNKARSVKSNFQQKFSKVFAVVEWESPEFKVWVGEYKTKLAADQALLKIRKEFPNAFIVNPKE